MSIFAGTYTVVIQDIDLYTLTLNEVENNLLTGRLSIVEGGANIGNVDLSGPVVPWSNFHSRYLFVLSGTYQVRSRNTEPPFLHTAIALVGYAETPAPTLQLDRLTAVVSFATDTDGHGNWAGSWQQAGVFTRETPE